MDTARLHFGPHSDSAPIRQSARQVLLTWYTLHLIDDALVVITELVQNGSQHTTSGGDLSMTRRADGVLIEVSDASPDYPAYTPPTRVGSAAGPC